VNWLNLELKTLRSTEYLGADPTQRATWINLLSFCADHENAGFISECKDWNDRKWMQLVGITKDEVESECDLWDYKSGGIMVEHYPLLQEQKVKRNRRNGKKGGRPSADKADGLPCGYPDGSDDGSSSLKRNSNSNSNRKGIVIETKEVAGAPAEECGESEAKQQQSPALPSPPKKAWVAPTQAEVQNWSIDWALKKGKSVAAVGVVAEEAWQYYERLDWKNAHGKQVKVWKTTIVGNWFSDEKIVKAQGGQHTPTQVISKAILPDFV